MNRGDDHNNRMLFHNGIMRRKRSLLNKDEQCELEKWIEDNAQERWEEVKHLWKATQAQGVNEMTAENHFIQEYVFLAFSSVFEANNFCFSARSTPSQLACRRPWMRSRG